MSLYVGDNELAVGGGEAATPTTRIVSIRYSGEAAATTPSKIVTSLNNVPVAGTIDENADFSVDGYQTDWGIVVEGTGIIDVLVSGRVESIAPGTFNSTGAYLDIYVYGNNDTLKSYQTKINYVGEASASSLVFGGSLRAYVEEWETVPGEVTSTHNVMAGFGVWTVSNGLGPDLGYGYLVFDVLWTPLA